MINNVTNNSTDESGFKAFFDNEMFTALRKAHEEWNNLSEVKKLVRHSKSLH